MSHLLPDRNEVNINSISSACALVSFACIEAFMRFCNSLNHFCERLIVFTVKRELCVNCSDVLLKHFDFINIQLDVLVPPNSSYANSFMQYECIRHLHYSWRNCSMQHNKLSRTLIFNLFQFQLQLICSNWILKKCSAIYPNVIDIPPLNLKACFCGLQRT